MSARTYAASAPVTPASLRCLRAFFENVLRAEGRAEPERIVLALDEACSNVVKHRCPSIDDGQLRVSLRIDGQRTVCRIGGFCAAKDVDQIKPRPLAEVRPGGLGTSFIAQIMQRVGYEPDPESEGGLALVMEHEES